MQTLRVADDFTTVPAGRYKSDGPYSGEQFRKKCLVPAFKSGNEVVVYLDGVEGYGSSFLEEAFGGLVREEGFDKSDILKRLRLVSSDDAYVSQIIRYIENSEPNSRSIASGALAKA